MKPGKEIAAEMWGLWRKWCDRPPARDGDEYSAGKRAGVGHCAFELESALKSLATSEPPSAADALPVPGAAVRALAEELAGVDTDDYRLGEVMLVHGIAQRLRAALAADGLASQELPAREELAQALREAYWFDDADGETAALPWDQVGAKERRNYLREADAAIELLARRPATDEAEALRKRLEACEVDYANECDRARRQEARLDQRIAELESALANERRERDQIEALSDEVDASKLELMRERDGARASADALREALLELESLQTATHNESMGRAARIRDLESLLASATRERDALQSKVGEVFATWGELPMARAEPVIGDETARMALKAVFAHCSGVTSWESWGAKAQSDMVTTLRKSLGGGDRWGSCERTSAEYIALRVRSDRLAYEEAEHRVTARERDEAIARASHWEAQHCAVSAVLKPLEQERDELRRERDEALAKLEEARRLCDEAVTDRENAWCEVDGLKAELAARPEPVVIDEALAERVMDTYHDCNDGVPREQMLSALRAEFGSDRASVSVPQARPAHAVRVVGGAALSESRIAAEFAREDRDEAVAERDQLRAELEKTRAELEAAHATLGDWRHLPDACRALREQYDALRAAAIAVRNGFSASRPWTANQARLARMLDDMLKPAPPTWQHISSDGDSHTFRHANGAVRVVEGFDLWAEAERHLDEPAPAEAEPDDDSQSFADWCAPEPIQHPPRVRLSGGGAVSLEEHVTPDGDLCVRAIQHPPPEWPDTLLDGTRGRAEVFREALRAERGRLCAVESAVRTFLADWARGSFSKDRAAEVLKTLDARVDRG